MNNELKTPLEKLNLTDRFLFSETMDEPEAYEAMVGILLEDEIELLDRTQTEKELRVSPQLRAVRLDVVNMDKNGQVYFTEMQKTDTGSLIRRSRYYQAQMDVSLLEPGDSGACVTGRRNKDIHQYFWDKQREFFPGVSGFYGVYQ